MAGPTAGQYKMERVLDSSGATEVDYVDATTGDSLMFNAAKKPVSQFPFQRIRAQTNASGLYTYTYPVAYPSGTLPIVQITPEDTSGGSSTISHKITALSNTSLTVALTRTTPVTLLAISVLGVSAAAITWVHISVAPPIPV